MPDPIGQPAPAGEPQPSPAPAPAAQPEPAAEPTAISFLNEDGTFKDGWVEALTPEDFRTPADKVAYGSVNGLRAVLKQLAHQNRAIQKQGKGIMPLGENPTPTDVEMYRKAMGIPDAPEGYKVEVPEGLGDYYDEGVMKDTLAAFHAAHLTPPQVAAVMALDAKRLQAGIKEQEEAEGKAREEVEATLREDWGEKYDENLRLANRVIAENVSDEDKDELLPLIGNNVKVAKFLSKLGVAFLEDKPVNTDGDRPSGLTSEIDRLEATPGYGNGELRRTDRKRHDEIVARLAILYRRKFPEPAATT